MVGNAVWKKGCLWWPKTWVFHLNNLHILSHLLPLTLCLFEHLPFGVFNQQICGCETGLPLKIFIGHLPLMEVIRGVSAWHEIWPYARHQKKRRFSILAAIVLKIQDFWVFMPCRLANIYRRFKLILIEPYAIAMYDILAQYPFCSDSVWCKWSLK